ncbi:MAG: maltose/maltodextrin transport permease-like protein [bacterium TMED198]|nr:MAG: maltose/maltodextrin transport permease-like protein [bacterium TMED198]
MYTYLKKIVLLFIVSPFLLADSITTINIWHQMLYENRKVLRDVCDKYEKNNPEININLTYRETEELRSSYQAAAMGGSGPELIYGPSDQVGPFSVMGIIQPLDKLFSKKYFNQFVENAVVRSMGKVWMVGDVVGNHLMLIYNKDLVRYPPKNTNELIRIGKELTLDINGNGKIDQYGLVWNFTEPFFYVPWLGGFGEWLLTENETPNLNTKGNKKGFRFIKSLRDEHKIIPKECDYEIANAMFKTGRAAMIINGDWSWGDYQGVVDFGIARIPKVSETGLWPSPLVSTKGYSINANIKGSQLDQTIKLMKHLTSEEIQLYFTTKLNSQPSSKDALNSSIVKNNKLLKESSHIIEVGRPMPIIPEMRAIWDALRDQYQAVLGGTVSAQDAAKKAQENALKQIKVMNEKIEPGIQGNIIKIIIFALIFGLIFIIGKQVPDFISDYKKNKIAYIFFAPALLAIAAVIIFPFVYNIVISLSNYSLRTFNDWDIIGLYHYIKVFGDSNFYLVLIKTFIWTALNIIFHVSIGIFLAVLINQTLPAKPIIRTLLIIPWAIPQYIAALSWRGMFNQEYGAINIALVKYFNLPAVEWLSQPFEAFTACILTNIWLGFPFMMVIALGGLQSIPQDLYEAARVDGANRWQQFKSITLPLLKPVMLPAIVLGTVWTFNNINVMWLVSNGGEPSNQTHILVSFVYKAAFNLYRYGYAAALSMIIFLILFGLVSYFIKRTRATEGVY